MIDDILDPDLGGDDLPPGVTRQKPSALPPGVVAQKPQALPPGVVLKKKKNISGLEALGGGSGQAAPNRGGMGVPDDWKKPVREIVEATNRLGGEYKSAPVKASSDTVVSALGAVPRLGEKLIEAPIGLYSLLDPEGGESLLRNTRDFYGWTGDNFQTDSQAGKVGAGAGDLAMNLLEVAALGGTPLSRGGRLLTTGGVMGTMGAAGQANLANSVNVPNETPEQKAHRVRVGAAGRGVTDAVMSTVPISDYAKRALTPALAVSAEAAGLTYANQKVNKMSGLPSSSGGDILQDFLLNLGMGTGAHLAGKGFKRDMADKFASAPQATAEDLGTGAPTFNAKPNERAVITAQRAKLASDQARLADSTALQGAVLRLREKYGNTYNKEVSDYLSYKRAGLTPPEPSEGAKAYLNDPDFRLIHDTITNRAEVLGQERDPNYFPVKVVAGYGDEQPSSGQVGALGKTTTDSQKTRRVKVLEANDSGDALNPRDIRAVRVSGDEANVYSPEGLTDESMVHVGDGQWVSSRDVAAYKRFLESQSKQPGDMSPVTVDEAVGIRPNVADDPYANPQARRPVVGGGGPESVGAKVSESGAVLGKSDLNYGAGIDAISQGGQDVSSGPGRPTVVPKTYKLREGTLPEIESMTPLRHEYDPAIVGANAALSAGDVARTQSIKNVLKNVNMLADPADVEGTKAAQFADWKELGKEYGDLAGSHVHPELKEVLDGIAKKTGETPDGALRSLNNAVLKAQFQINPAAHMKNMGSHFVKGATGIAFRYPEVIPKLGELSDQAVLMEKSIRENKPTPEAIEYLRSGGVVMGGSGGRKYGERLNGALDALLKRENGSDMPNPTETSDRVTWQNDDRARMMLYLMRRAGGETSDVAVNNVNKQYPSYQAYQKPTGVGPVDKALDWATETPLLVFQRYARGKVNALSSMVEKAASKSPGDKAEALGNAVGMGLNYTLMGLGLSAAVKAISGDDRKKAALGGGEHLISDASDVTQGKLGPLDFAAKQAQLSPASRAIASAVGATGNGYNPNDWYDAMHGKPVDRNPAVKNLLRQGVKNVAGASAQGIPGVTSSGDDNNPLVSLLGAKKDYTATERELAKMQSYQLAPDAQQQATMDDRSKLKKLLSSDGDISGVAGNGNLGNKDIVNIAKSVARGGDSRATQLGEAASKLPAEQIVRLLETAKRDGSAPEFDAIMASSKKHLIAALRNTKGSPNKYASIRRRYADLFGEDSVKRMEDQISEEERQQQEQGNEQ